MSRVIHAQGCHWGSDCWKIAWISAKNSACQSDRPRSACGLCRLAVHVTCSTYLIVSLICKVKIVILTVLGYGENQPGSICKALRVCLTPGHILGVSELCPAPAVMGSLEGRHQMEYKEYGLLSRENSSGEMAVYSFAHSFILSTHVR